RGLSPGWSSSGRCVANLGRMSALSEKPRQSTLPQLRDHRLGCRRGCLPGRGNSSFEEIKESTRLVVLAWSNASRSLRTNGWRAPQCSALGASRRWVDYAQSYFLPHPRCRLHDRGGIVGRRFPLLGGGSFHQGCRSRYPDKALLASPLARVG